MLFFFFLFFFPTLSFATTVKDEVLVWSKVQPDTYSLSITVKAKAPSEEGVLSALKVADDFLRKTGFPYRGGNFNLWPERVWNQKEKRYEFEGFEGSASYTFYFTSPSLQVKLFKALKDAKEYANFNYEVNSAGWELSWEKRQEVLNSLKMKVLKEAKSEARKLGELLGQSCKISDLDFSYSHFPVYSVLAKGVGAPIPSRNLKRVEVRAQLKFNCK